ncbi:4Fe-4S binding protein [Sunxiuqinia sp. A32]|uniref:4Fe-4S binding protein n=1 Tax=Sunxiuqinia sp. A32 TaxID=3461496 RepID=UPI0040457F86
MKRQILRKRISTISFFLFPATFVYFSPYVIVDASAKGIICGSFFLFILLFIGSLFFGRAFCSWACALGGAQEILSPLKNKFAIKGRIIKWFIWVPWISTILFIAIRQGGYQEINPLFRTNHGFSLGSIYTAIAYLAVLLVLLLAQFLVGKRSFCRHICWIAPFMILGTEIRKLLKTPSLKLVKRDSPCISCKRCTKNCLMGLDVENMIKTNNMENAECILCGNCVDVCNKECIKLKFK